MNRGEFYIGHKRYILRLLLENHLFIIGLCLPSRIYFLDLLTEFRALFCYFRITTIAKIMV